MNLRPTLFIFSFFFLLTDLSAQSNSKIDKAIETFNSGNMDKGISMMEKIKDKDPSEDNWNLLVKMYSTRYDVAKRNSSDVAAAMILQMGGMKEKDFYTNTTESYSEMISKSREALLYSQSPQASMILRIYLVDHEIDTGITSKAIEEFRKAEKYFAEKDYENARIYYQKALDIEPNFYKAAVYVGDSYWYLENMDSAIVYFRKGIEMEPNLLEPRKYLVDALAFDQQNEEAKEESIKAIYIYPDQSMFMKYDDVLEREGKKLNKHWIKRGCEVNVKGQINSKSKDQIWNAYQSAGEEISKFCDDAGIITMSNELTKSKYMEVYSWEKMLKNSTELPEEFSFAKEMAEKGFLDCYVFISMFHNDFYAQYADFAKNNKERIKTFIETYLTE